MRSSVSALEKMRTLDLAPIAFKLSGCKEGKGWTLERTNHAIEQYRHWLALVALFPGGRIIPTHDVDEVWHHHILDTMKYAEDMNRVLGYYLHHFPYFGMRGAEDKQALKDAFAQTQVLLEENFGMRFSLYGSGSTDGVSSLCGPGNCDPTGIVPEGALCGPENCEPSCSNEDVGSLRVRPKMDTLGNISLSG